jgi:hypothetical protein
MRYWIAAFLFTGIIFGLGLAANAQDEVLYATIDNAVGDWTGDFITRPSGTKGLIVRTNVTDGVGFAIDVSLQITTTDGVIGWTQNCPGAGAINAVGIWTCVFAPFGAIGHYDGETGDDVAAELVALPQRFKLFYDHGSAVATYTVIYQWIKP